MFVCVLVKCRRSMLAIAKRIKIYIYFYGLQCNRFSIAKTNLAGGNILKIIIEQKNRKDAICVIKRIVEMASCGTVRKRLQNVNETRFNWNVLKDTYEAFEFAQVHKTTERSGGTTVVIRRTFSFNLKLYRPYGTNYAQNVFIIY